MKQDLLARLREGEELTTPQQLQMVAHLSAPAIMAQISSILMQYIDASMVGQLGANDSASIGLVSSSTWLFGGLSSFIFSGFTVLVAQRIGAQREREARDLMKQSYVITLAVCLLIALIGALLSPVWPIWLGGGPEIRKNSSIYFLIYVLSLPIVQIGNLSGSMLQASGNMKIPSILHVLMCLMDVIFNLMLIFPQTVIGPLVLPGANLGVLGAALGTALAQLVTALLMLFFLLVRSPMLHLRRGEGLHFHKGDILHSIRISIPVGIESMVMSGAQVVSTRIVAPLGNVAIAANSFAVTAESFCYMPGYGIGQAASILIGQSIGAKRLRLTERFGFITTALGAGVMLLTGILMYFAAPVMIGLLSPDPAVVALGTAVLRIEAFAEPFYGSSIVASGVFRGAGDTMIPTLLNFCSMWFVRLPISALLAPRLGLHGVWIAMCLELCFRGILFLIRLFRKKWLRTYTSSSETTLARQ